MALAGFSPYLHVLWRIAELTVYVVTRWEKLSLGAVPLRGAWRPETDPRRTAVRMCPPAPKTHTEGPWPCRTPPDPGDLMWQPPAAGSRQRQPLGGWPGPLRVQHSGSQSTHLLTVQLVAELGSLTTG